MTKEELISIVDKFNDEHDGKIEATLHITDIVAKKAAENKAVEEFAEKTKDNKTLEEIKKDFPLTDFGTIHGEVNNYMHSGYANSLFLLTVTYDKFQGEYHFMYTNVTHPNWSSVPDTNKMLDIQSLYTFLDVIEMNIAKRESLKL